MSDWLASEWTWVHMDIDRTDGHDGIDYYDLRSGWNAFRKGGSARLLAQSIRDHAASVGAPGAVLSFPSTALFGAGCVREAAIHSIKAILLWGSAADCRQAFVQREQASPRRLDGTVWDRNNHAAMLTYAHEDFDPLRVWTFQENGTRRDRAEVVAECRRIVAADRP